MRQDMERLQAQNKKFAIETIKQNEIIDRQNQKLSGLREKISENFNLHVEEFNKWFEKIDLENRQMLKNEDFLRE